MGCTASTQTELQSLTRPTLKGPETNGLKLATPNLNLSNNAAKLTADGTASFNNMSKSVTDGTTAVVNNATKAVSDTSMAITGSVNKSVEDGSAALANLTKFGSTPMPSFGKFGSAPTPSLANENKPAKPEGKPHPPEDEDDAHFDGGDDE